MVAHIINKTTFTQSNWGKGRKPEPVGFCVLNTCPGTGKALAEYSSGVFLLHRVLVQNYSRPLELQANNSEVPFDATWKLAKAMCKLTSFDLQTLGKSKLPPAGISGYLSIGC